MCIRDSYYPHINEDGSITFYHPVVEINCAEENKFFYSQDGKLYDKETDELISDFAYIDDCMESVSYTHLDVYKRQVKNRIMALITA